MHEGPELVRLGAVMSMEFEICLIQANLDQDTVNVVDGSQSLELNSCNFFILIDCSLPYCGHIRGSLYRGLKV